MSITLRRLVEDPIEPPPAGRVTIAVARHDAEVWPSPEVDEYARQRARLLHGLDDDPGVRVVSWGETDGAIPREVVQVIVDLSQAVLPSVAAVLAAWISVRPRKRKDRGDTSEPSVPGLVVKRADGARLEVTYRTEPRKKERERLLRAFLDV